MLSLQLKLYSISVCLKVSKPQVTNLTIIYFQCNNKIIMSLYFQIITQGLHIICKSCIMKHKPFFGLGLLLLSLSDISAAGKRGFFLNQQRNVFCVNYGKRNTSSRVAQVVVSSYPFIRVCHIQRFRQWMLHYHNDPHHSYRVIINK